MRFLIFICVLVTLFSCALSAPSFVISDDGSTFLKDGAPFRIISGSVHYFRMHEALYNDRLQKAKSGGLNAVQTYIPWNFHNPEQGVYNLTTLVNFLQAAKDNGLLVILRPGPYACGEWEFGGFPYWLLSISPTITLRSSDPLFLNAVSEWWAVLLPSIQPFLYSNGGNVVLLQVENEYGSYGNDKVYLNYLVELFVKYLGDKSVIFHSTDGNDNFFLIKTFIPGVYQTVDFGPGSDAADAFASQTTYAKYGVPGPYMNSEYYTGWLTRWGDAKMANTTAAEVAQYLDDILGYKNASVNMYMYYGGTNFGFWNGANTASTTFQPVVTSYDYDGPLNEAGDPTDKYFQIRDVIAKYSPVPSGPLPTPSEKGNYGPIYLTEQVTLFEENVLQAPLTTGISTASTYSFERLGLGYGFVLYSTSVSRLVNVTSTLSFTPKDRAWVYFDGEYLGIVHRGVNSSIQLPAKATKNMGRVNYGPMLTDFKGLGPVGITCDNYFLFNWISYPLSLSPSSIAKLPYWWVGPQLSLYVPAPVLVAGENEVIIFETEGTYSDTITSQTTPTFSS